MGFPAGMQLATIAFGIPLTATGKNVVTKVTVKPTSRVIWAATGQPLPEFSDSFTAEAGQLGSFQVPFVDQAGFIDSTGAAVTDFAYQISASWEFGNERPITWDKNLKPLVGQTDPIDLDLVPDGPVSIPVTAPTAAVLGFGGRTGFVTLQESDLPQRLSVGDLSATYGPTAAGMLSAFVRPERDQSDVDMPGVNLKLYGQVLANGSGGAFDETAVESPSVFLDPATGRLAMAYVAYKGSGGTQEASVGLAYSDDGLTWTKSGQILAKSGTPGTPDENGCTGPIVLFDNGTYHMFYIGLTALGYEGGEKAICHATATTLTGPWTRHGAVITKSGSGWRSTAVWHPNLVRAKGKWWMFFNATGTVDGQTGVERSSVASADTLAGPWTVDDANAPIFPNAANVTDKLWGTDPFVHREGDHWRADFARADASWTPIGDYWATTTDELFPYGWTVRGQATSYAAGQGIKPWVIRKNGQILHYASKSGGAIGIVLSIGLDTTNTKQTITERWRFAGAQVDGQDSTLLLGDDIRTSTAMPRTKLQLGKSTGNSELILGQADGRSLVINWNYNATAANATAGIETYAGANQLNIQNNNGNLLLVGSGGKLGFHGTAPIARQTGTPAAATDLATALTLVNDLRAKLLALGVIA